MQTLGIQLDAMVDSKLWDMEIQGKSGICVAYNNTMFGVLGIADRVKPDAAQAVSSLRDMGIDVWMVTGDNRTTAEAIADELDIPKDRVIASAMPATKASKVAELQKSGRIVAVVGDGINDSPALAQADLGIAVGAGSQVATEAADMVLIRNQLSDVVMALDLARIVFNRIKINFLWATIYNILAIPFAAGLWYPWTHLSVPPQYAGMLIHFSSDLLYFLISFIDGPFFNISSRIFIDA
jgi:Cu+-exporting ATPase